MAINTLNMTVTEFMDYMVMDVVILFFYFMILPIGAFLTSMASGDDSNEAPYNYVFSAIVYLVAVSGVISACFWAYSLMTGGKSLWTLNFAVYYLPLLSTAITLFLISKKTNISRLPWFGELYELLAMIVGVFGFILLIMHLQVIKFGHWWQVLLVFVVLFGIVKLSWERLTRMTR